MIGYESTEVLRVMYHSLTEQFVAQEIQIIVKNKESFMYQLECNASGSTHIRVRNAEEDTNGFQTTKNANAVAQSSNESTG